MLHIYIYVHICIGVLIKFRCMEALTSASARHRSCHVVPSPGSRPEGQPWSEQVSRAVNERFQWIGLRENLQETTGNHRFSH